MQLTMDSSFTGFMKSGPLVDVMAELCEFRDANGVFVNDLCLNYVEMCVPG